MLFELIIGIYSALQLKVNYEQSDSLSFCSTEIVQILRGLYV